MAKAVLGIALAVLLTAAVPGAVAQQLAAHQQAKITVHVTGALGVQMPEAPIRCSDCVIRVPLSWNLTHPKTAKMTLLADVTEFNPTSGTLTTAQNAVVKPADSGSSYALISVRGSGAAVPKILTIRLQHY